MERKQPTPGASSLSLFLNLYLSPSHHDEKKTSRDDDGPFCLHLCIYFIVSVKFFFLFLDAESTLFVLLCVSVAQTVGCCTEN